MLILLLRTLFPLLMHPFFVSVTEMEYRSGEAELGISTKFFTDDFEETLKKFGNKKIDLKNGDTAANRKLIESYIRNHIQISVNNQPITFQLLGYEIDKEATWCFYYAGKIPKIKQVDLTADFLYEFKKEQTNLFHVIIDGNRKSSRLNSPETKLSFSF